MRGDQVLAVVVWTRTRRLPLVVQNNRFLVLSQVRQPNLASRVLGLAVAALPAQWEKRTGATPLPAETFVDPERYAGTCYKAFCWPAEWIGLGRDRPGLPGPPRRRLPRRARAPKRLWLRPLASDARERLREPIAPLAGEKQRAFGELPVPARTAASLAGALRQVADPRRAAPGKPGLHAMLASAVLALACGARTVSDLFRFAQELTAAQRRALPGKPGLLAQPRLVGAGRAPARRTDPRRRRLAAGANDPATLAPGKPGRQNAAPRPRHARHPLRRAQTPGLPGLVQVARCGQGHDPPAHELVDALPPGTLDGAVGGGDALYADTALVRQLVQEQGAITLVQLKNNQPTVAPGLPGLLAQNAPLFFSTPLEPPASRGRIDQRHVRILPVTPEQLGFVHAAQLLEINPDSESGHGRPTRIYPERAAHPGRRAPGRARTLWYRKQESSSPRHHLADSAGQQNATSAVCPPPSVNSFNHLQSGSEEPCYGTAVKGILLTDGHKDTYVCKYLESNLAIFASG